MTTVTTVSGGLSVTSTHDFNCSFLLDMCHFCWMWHHTDVLGSVYIYDEWCPIKMVECWIEL